ncbi:unnamed protein product [Paramecium octaurelia]|uniref:Uncharacterized protein n=1 Tax=Paramecium octaurelia TaxID=43137 RepID=A0A8S1TA47_PAROT|nr:unnamed protein product [Paramecium octaurelia]
MIKETIDIEKLADTKTIILEQQNQIETLKDRIQENGLTKLELKLSNQQARNGRARKKGRLYQLNTKYQMIDLQGELKNNGTKKQRNIHQKQIYILKMLTNQILQKFVTLNYDEQDECCKYY